MEMAVQRFVHKLNEPFPVRMQHFRALLKRKRNGAVAALVCVVAGGLVAQKVNVYVVLYGVFKKVHYVAVIRHGKPLLRFKRGLCPCEHLVKVSAYLIHPALVKPCLYAAVINLRNDGRGAGDLGSLALRAAHAAKAAGYEHMPVQIVRFRNAQKFAPRAKYCIERAVNYALRAYVHPAAGGHLPVIGNAHFLGNLPIVRVIEHANH